MKHDLNDSTITNDKELTFRFFSLKVKLNHVQQANDIKKAGALVYFQH